MTNGIVAQEDFQEIVDRWLELEANGEKFPVDFDTAWQLAGYSRKSVAKRRLVRFEKDKNYCTQECKSLRGGRSSELIYLSCDTFKEFCLLAETEQGDNIRKYFIEAEKKWKLVQSHFPQVASEVETIHLKIELAKLEAQKEVAIAQAKQADLQLIQFRHTVTQTCPEPVQQKILGYQVVEKVEYRDRLFQGDLMLNDGSTISKTELCHRYGFLTRNGKPNYRQLNWFLDATGTNKISDAWELSATIQENQQLRREFIPVLDKLILEQDRQLNICE